MDKSITDNAAEQIAVNPGQTEQLVKNESKLTDTNEYLRGVFDSNIVTERTNKTLGEVSNWNEYLADPVRATMSKDPKFEKLGPTMDMARDPIWYSLAQKYGKDLTHKTETLLGYYKPKGSKLSRAIDAYNFQSDSLELAETRKKLSDAVAAGDTEAQAEYENKIAHLKNRLEHYDAPLNSFAGDSIEAIAASIARVGPTIFAIEGAEKIAKSAITGAEVAGAAGTGGVSVPAGELMKRGVGAIATTAETALVYKDTYNVEYGSVLHDIMSTRPDLPEEKAREIADFVGKVNGALEAGGTLVGTSIAKLVGTEFASAAAGQAGRKGIWAAIKTLSKNSGPAATKAAIARIFKEAADMGIDILSNDAQEILQEVVSHSGVEAAENGGDVAKISMNELIGFIKDPFAPEYQYLRETGLGTTYGVGAVGGATRLLTGGVARVSRSIQNRRQPRSIEQQGIGAMMNGDLADKLHEIRQNSEVPDEAQKKLWEQTTARGIAPENIYIDKQMAEALMKDPSVSAAMEKLGMQAALQESNSNGGVVEIDFATYDEVVNKDDALYQKIRGAISFSPEALSLNQFQAYLDSLGAATREEIERARTLTDSVYNQTLAKLDAMGVRGASAESQAFAAQFIANRIATLRLGQNETGEQAFSRLEIRTPGQPVTPTTPEPTTPTATTEEIKRPAGMVDYTLPEMLEQPTTYTKKGGLKQDVWKKIKALFTPEQLAARFGEEGNQASFEDLLNNTLVYPRTGELRDDMIRDIAGRYNVTPQQVYNAMALSRGEETRTFPADPEGIYNKNTIEVDGVSRPTNDSNHNRIAWTEQELIDFWRWFGDSKAVNTLGRPIPFKLSEKQEDKFGSGVYYDVIEGKPSGEYGFLRVMNPAEYDTYSYSDEDIRKAYEQEGVDGATNRMGLWVVRSEEQYREAPLSSDMEGSAAPSVEDVGKNDIVSKDGEHIVHVNPTPQELQGLLNREGEQRLLISPKTGNWYFAKAEDSIHGDIREAVFDNDLEESAAFGDFEEYMVDNGSRIRYEGYYFLYGTKANITWFEYAPKTVEESKTEYDNLVAKHPKMARYIGEFDEKKNATVLLVRMDEEVGSLNMWAEEEEKDPEIKSQHDARRGYLAEQKKELMSKYGIVQPDIDNFFTNQRPRILNQFVGGTAKLAETAPELATRYKKAQQMMFHGKDDEEIFKETHLHVAPDGSIRVQISDKEAKVKPDIKRLLAWKPKEKKYTMRRKTTLGEVFSHPVLFELYPWLKDVEVSVSKTTQEYTKKYRENGVVTRMEHFIEIKNDEPDSRLRQSFLHEIQHAIQDHEGWAKGGREGSSNYIPTQEERNARDERNKLLKEIFETLHDNKVYTYWDASDSRVPTYRTLEPEESRSLGKVMEDIAKENPEFAEQLKRLKELNKTLENYDEHDPRMKYFQLFGEAEARLTEKLSYMSQEELDALDPYQYFDVTQARVKMSRSDRGFWVTLPENQQKVGEFDVELGFTEPLTKGDTSENKVIAGTFFRDGDKLVISLTPNANATTLTHELFHWFSYELQDAYNSGLMTDYWKKKVEAMARMVDANFEIDPVDPNVKRLYLTPAQEEKAADMFLSFIKDGKIQNQEVRPLFSYLQDEFRRVFKLAEIQGYKMSPSAYELFNAIFSAQDVIEDEQRMVGMLQIVKPENADQDLYDFYTGEMASSQVRGTQELYKKLFGIDKYRKSEEYRKQYDETRLEVAQELNQDTRYIVLEEAGKNANDPRATWMSLQMNPETADLQLSMDQVADIIATTPDKTTEINRITDERMNEYIQERFKITPEEMGLKASRNASKVKALLAEALMREGKKLADFDDEYRVLSDMAEDQIAKTKLSRLADKEYWDTLESNIVERYAYALINKDERAMAQARRDQAIVNAIRMRAEGITNRAKRFQETAEDFRGAQKKNTKTNEFKYAAKDYDLLQSILEKFGFPINYARRKPTTAVDKLNTWIDEQEATTLTRVGELRNFIPFIDEGFDGKFASMTGAQFEKLEAVFNAVKSVAGAKYSITLANEKTLLSEMVAATSRKMDALGIGPFNKKDSYWAKHFGVMGTFTNPEPIVRALFPQEVLNKVWLPFIDAGVRAERYGREWVERYRTAKGKVDISNKAKTYSTGRALTNRDVADLLLAMGNQHAYDNFLLSYENMTAQEAEQIVSEALVDQPGLADFAKEVWDIYAKASEQLDKEFEERTNTLFVEKSHRSFELNGIQFAGGYVPARKALDYVPTDARAGNQGGMVRDKRFEKLITKKADGNIRSIIDITENELFQSAKQGFSAVEYNNARKFLLADGTKATIGDRAFSFLSQWMEAYLAPQYDVSAWIRPLQKLTSMSALGWRFSTALIQLSGLGPAAVELGPTYWARGITMAMKNGEWAPHFATKKGANKSDYMFVRIADPRSSLLGNSIIDSVRATNAKTKLGKAAKYLMGKVGNSAMWGIQQVDTAVANITWDGAYLRALDKGLSEVEARREADSVVRIVQSDSLKISRSQGMQDPLARVFTVFATWIMAMQSNLRAKLGTGRYSNALVWAAMYMLLSPLLEAFLKEATKPEVLFGDGDDDEDYLDRVRHAWYNELASTVGTSVVPVAGLGGTAVTMALSGIEEGITDEKKLFKPYQSNVPAMQTAYRGLNTLRYALAGDLEKAATYGASTISTEAGKIVKYLLAE